MLVVAGGLSRYEISMRTPSIGSTYQHIPVKEEARISETCFASLARCSFGHV